MVSAGNWSWNYIENPRFQLFRLKEFCSIRKSQAHNLIKKLSETITVRLDSQQQTKSQLGSAFNVPEFDLVLIITGILLHIGQSLRMTAHKAEWDFIIVGDNWLRSKWIGILIRLIRANNSISLQFYSFCDFFSRLIPGNCRFLLYLVFGLKHNYMLAQDNNRKMNDGWALLQIQRINFQSKSRSAMAFWAALARRV